MNNYRIDYEALPFGGSGYKSNITVAATNEADAKRRVKNEFKGVQAFTILKVSKIPTASILAKVAHKLVK